jgi:lipoate---protein ligase
MLCIVPTITDPYFNIASEEYLLKNFSDDIFLLYRNNPSVIVGKHQNTFAEINYWFVKEKNIKVVRRLSGGGTVYHDTGNLNFCFIRNGQIGSLVDFQKFTQPIVEMLQAMGIPAERSGRNDLTINGLKISGNAEHIYKNRTLHHGTLLISAYLENLKGALQNNAENYHDKAIKSVRSKVTNLREYLPTDLTIELFRERLVEHIFATFPDIQPHVYSDTDLKAIQQLVDQKYSTWEWNFGYSPKFTFKNCGKIDNDIIDIEIDIDKGMIQRIMIKLNNNTLPDISETLLGVAYQEKTIRAKLQQLNYVEVNALTSLFF